MKAKISVWFDGYDPIYRVYAKEDKTCVLGWRKVASFGSTEEAKEYCQKLEYKIESAETKGKV